MESPFQKVIDLMRIHQQRSHFVGSAYETPLSLIEAYIVIEVDIDSRVTIAELAKTLILDKSTIARAIRRLQSLGFLRSGADPSDRRKRQLQLTSKALKFLEQHDQESRRFLDEHLSRLTIEEISELQHFQHLICDSVNAPKVKLRISEHPFEEGIRRVTRALGFIGPSLFGSGYSSTVWQILSFVASSQTPLQPSDLSRSLGIHPSTLSQMIARYEKNGWIKSKRGSHDKRTREIVLLNNGRQTLDAIDQSGARLIENAFINGKAGSAKRFAEILGKHLGILDVSQPNILRKELKVIALHSDLERQEARGFLIFHLVRLRRYTEIPETLIGKNHMNYALKEGEITHAVCEVIQEEGVARVTNFAYSNESLTSLLEFIEAVHWNLQNLNKLVTLNIPVCMLPKLLERELSGFNQIKLLR